MRRISSTAAGSSRLERSPASSPVTAARTARRTIFALRVLGSDAANTTRAGVNELPRCSRTRLSELGRERGGPGDTGAQDHHAPERLALDRMRARRPPRTPHGGVRRERRLDLGRTDPFARHVQGVVAPPVQEPVAVRVAARPVAVHPDPGEAPPVACRGSAPGRPRCRGSSKATAAGRRAPPPRPGSTGTPVRIDDVDVHPERGPAERVDLERHHRVRRQEARAHLGAAREVHDRQPAARRPLGGARGRRRGSRAPRWRPGSGATSGRASGRGPSRPGSARARASARRRAS